MHRHSRFPSDFAKMTKDIPLSVTKARADTAKSRKSSKGTPAIGGMAKAKARDGAIKKKPSSKKAAAAKKTKKSARRQQRDSTLESEPDHDEDENEERGSPGPQLFLEGDPGFEAAFQASRRARPSQQAQGTARRPQVPPPREAPRAPRTSTARNFSQDDVSDLELLGDNEGSTLVAPTQRADTATTPRVIAPPPQIIDRPSPVRHQRISAITGLAFAGPRRRPEALGGYGDSHTRRRGSPVRNSRVAASTGVSIAEADSGRGVVAGNSYAARLGLPVAQPNRPPQDVYVRAPDGSHHHYTDDSGVPTYVTHPDPSTTSHVGYTSNQRRQGHTQTNAPAQPVHPSQNPQPVSPSSTISKLSHATDTDTLRQTSQNPADAPNDQRNLVATNRRTTRVAEATASHHNAIIEEMRRRQSWPLEQIGRLNREIMDAMRDDDDDFASGFLEREMERERRERQHSSEEDDD